METTSVLAESLIEWPKPIVEGLGFVSNFLLTGALGFRASVLRGRLAAAATEASSTEVLGRIYSDSARGAATIGISGALLGGALLAFDLPEQAARKHLAIPAFVAGNAQVALQIGFLVLAVIGFVLAMRNVRAGWVLAAIGVVCGALRAAFVGRWASLVNPMHVLAGGLWIGTLFVLVVAGITAVLRDEPARDHRGAVVADMVNAFSPLALVAASVLVLFGVITAWRHLKRLDALWTTPYGYALIVKLCLVAVVFALGAWNWRKQRPTLGSEAAAISIRRSARAELMVAGLVLVVTSIVVSLPTPKAPKPPGAPPAVATAPSP